MLRHFLVRVLTAPLALALIVTMLSVGAAFASTSV
jgi:hypothetical protein